MKNSDKPTGQRIGDGRELGQPLHAQYMQRTHSLKHRERIRNMGWIDKTGKPHGRSGDKLMRKAMKNSLGRSVIR